MKPKINDRIVFLTDIDLYPDTIVDKGNRGTITTIGEQISVKLDIVDEHLKEWDNCVLFGRDNVVYTIDDFDDFCKVLTEKESIIDKISAETIDWGNK